MCVHVHLHGMCFACHVHSAAQTASAVGCPAASAMGNRETARRRAQRKIQEEATDQSSVIAQAAADVAATLLVLSKRSGPRGQPGPPQQPQEPQQHRGQGDQGNQFQNSGRSISGESSGRSRSARARSYMSDSRSPSDCSRRNCSSSYSKNRDRPSSKDGGKCKEARGIPLLVARASWCRGRP
jgi:hypothetical protein